MIEFNNFSTYCLNYPKLVHYWDLKQGASVLSWVSHSWAKLRFWPLTGRDQHINHNFPLFLGSLDLLLTWLNLIFLATCAHTMLPILGRRDNQKRWETREKKYLFYCHQFLLIFFFLFGFVSKLMLAKKFSMPCWWRVLCQFPAETNGAKGNLIQGRHLQPSLNDNFFYASQDFSKECDNWYNIILNKCS